MVKCKGKRGCPNPTYTRGLCNAHYQQSRLSVLAGKASWASLEAKGLASAPVRVRVKK